MCSIHCYSLYISSVTTTPRSTSTMLALSHSFLYTALAPRLFLFTINFPIQYHIHLIVLAFNSFYPQFYSFSLGTLAAVLCTYTALIKGIKGKDVDLYSASHVQDTSNVHFRHWKWAGRQLFRSPHSLQTQACAVTQQPATGSVSQQ